MPPARPPPMKMPDVSSLPSFLRSLLRPSGGRPPCGGGRPRAACRAAPSARARRHLADFFQPHVPVFPRARDRTLGKIVVSGALDLVAIERARRAEQLCLRQVFGVAAGVDRAEHDLAQSAAGDGCAMPAHHYHQCGPSALASEAPSAGSITRRLVSPKSSRWSQNGAFTPMTA